MDDRTDSTGIMPWSEPTYSGSPDTYKRALGGYRRAIQRASTTSTWTCPTCGTPWAGVNLEGKPRRGCPDPQCASLARGARARALGRHRHPHLPPETIAAIRQEYRPGVRGYKALAQEYGCHPTTVRDIVKGVTHRED